MATETPRDLIAKLLKRKEELRLESEALDNLIRTYQNLMMLSKDDRSNQLDLWKGANSRAAKSEYVAKMMSEIRMLILSEGRPLTRSELVRKLEQEGYIIEGKDKPKVLGTNIWRSERFMHIDGHGYWPKDVPMPKIS